MAVGAGLPPRQIEQNVGNVAGILGFVQTGRGIGLIFFLCDAGGFGIGGTIRNRVDRRAGNIGCIRQSVGMDRDEEGGITVPRHPDPFGESNETVAVTCHDNLEAPVGLEFGRDGLGKIENQVFFDEPFHHRASVDSAMARIDHDDGLHRCRLRFFVLFRLRQRP